MNVHEVPLPMGEGNSDNPTISRRGLIKGMAGVVAGAAASRLWTPRSASAETRAEVKAEVKQEELSTVLTIQEALSTPPEELVGLFDTFSAQSDGHKAPIMTFPEVGRSDELLVEQFFADPGDQYKPYVNITNIGPRHLEGRDESTGQPISMELFPWQARYITSRVLRVDTPDEGNFDVVFGFVQHLIGNPEGNEFEVPNPTADRFEKADPQMVSVSSLQPIIPYYIGRLKREDGYISDPVGFDIREVDKNPSSIDTGGRNIPAEEIVKNLEALKAETDGRFLIKLWKQAYKYTNGLEKLAAADGRPEAFWEKNTFNSATETNRDHYLNLEGINFLVAQAQGNALWRMGNPLPLTDELIATHSGTKTLAERVADLPDPMYLAERSRIHLNQIFGRYPSIYDIIAYVPKGMGKYAQTGNQLRQSPIQLAQKVQIWDPLHAVSSHVHIV
ncbi:MAG: hypothetical protein HYV40_04575 [Candidatus Levybacteria bacterium]|nr:hypothetical protein [Candidatus Levybacteria bacterium]